MLILTRRRSERIQVGEDVIFTICKISGGRVQIGIDAPKAKSVIRLPAVVKIRRDGELSK